MKKIHLTILLLSCCCFSSYAQSFVSQDTLLNPIIIRKHVEFALFGIFPSIGVGITTYKNKHSWAFTGSVGARNVRSSSIPVNDMILGSFQTEYRHKIKTKKSPVFWHLDAGLNYVKFHKSLDEIKRNNDNPFAEPSRLYTNVKGGFGVFVGYNRTEFKVDKLP
jgi:hypothetical protein